MIGAILGPVLRIFELLLETQAKREERRAAYEEQKRAELIAELKRREAEKKR